MLCGAQGSLQQQPVARRHASGSAREDQVHGGALAELAVDLQLAAMPLHHAKHHGETEPGAALTLGGEEVLVICPDVAARRSVEFDRLGSLQAASQNNLLIRNNVSVGIFDGMQIQRNSRSL